jgi:cohesin loading factor subunit SCC2
MDPTLMLQPAVTKAVSQRFRDDAKSVREAAVALVGSFVLQTPEVANTFHSSLLPCLTDAGVSVKKRAVRIFRDILQSNPSYRGRAAACAVMLRQAADPKEDDSVRDLIYELFTEMWLVGGQTATDTLPKLSARKSSKKAIDVSDQQLPLVTPLSPGGSSGVKSGKSPTTTPKTRCQLAAEQMVEVTLAAGTKDVVTSLMQELMFGLSAADADKDRKASEREGRKEALHKHSSNLVDALIEHLLRLEESRKDMSAKFGPKLVASIQTLGVFAQVAPAEVLRHGDILLPYLKADNGVSPEYETLIVAECCDIISQMISVMKSGDIVALGGSKLCDDLVRITYRFGSSALNSAVSLLSALANHSDTGKDSHAGQTLLKLVQTFYGYLSKSAGSADSVSLSPLF